MIFSCKKVNHKTIYKIDMDLEKDIAGEMIGKQDINDDVSFMFWSAVNVEFDQICKDYVWNVETNFGRRWYKMNILIATMEV